MAHSSISAKNLWHLVALFGLLTLISTASSTNAQDPTDANAGTADNKLPATPTDEPPLPASQPSKQMRDNTLIAKDLENESKWLDTRYGKILVLHRPTEAKTTHGVLVLFHAAETPQTWPPTLENLRRNLPRYGWETLAVTLPQAEPTLVPTRKNDPAPEDTPTRENTSPATPNPASAAISRDELIKEYLKVSFEFLQTTGQFNAVVLFDNSTLVAGMQHLSPQIKENENDPKTVDGPLQALIIANLQPQETLDKHQLEAVLNQRQLPVLDIFYAPDSRQQHTQRELHRAVALRKKLDNYHQFLAETPSKNIENDHAYYLLGRVRGFMKEQATGSEINKKGSSNAPTQ